MAATVDLGDFEAKSSPRKKLCPLTDLCGTLPDKEALLAALDADPSRITPKGISAWLEERGFTVSWKQVDAHRSRVCTCAKRGLL